MKKEIRYILNKNEITCIGDVRRAKTNLMIVADNVDNIDKNEIRTCLNNAIKELANALIKLEVKENGN